MKKRGLKCLVILFFIMFLPVITAQLESGVCVEAEIADISPSSVEIGEEFTVGVHIENCGDELPEEVIFEIITLPTDISVKEPLLIKVSQIRYANSERFINYHMKTSDQAESGTYIIETRLSYSGRQKDYDIEINVIGDEAELGIASIKTDPVLPIEGDIVELTLRVENAGEGTAKSVRVYADHPFQGLKQSFIGALESEEDGPVILTFIVDKAGEHTIPVTISYNDDFGNHEIKTEINITVLEKPLDILRIIFTVVTLVLIGGGIYYFFKVKKSKDKIIHQLLKGNDSKEKK